jgi:tetratricopeptide (TPR) repeat protein
MLDLAGLPVPVGLDGRSLRPAAEGKEMADAPAYAESLYPEREFGWAPLFAVRTARHKLIEAPRPELYDLQADAGEAANRIAQDAATAESLRGKLEAALARPARSAAAKVDADTAERLAALGYLGGGQAPGAGSAGSRAGRDPKDGVRLMPRLNRGMSAARTDPPLAIRELGAVLAEDPGLLMARRTLAVAYAAAGQHDRAVAELRRLEKDGDLSAEDAIVLGDNLRSGGRLAEAAEVLERAARDHPRFAQPWLSLAEVHIKAGRNAEAAAAYERVLTLVPDHLEALRGLGDIALLEGRVDAAAARYGRILEVDPADAGALSKTGVLKMRAGQRGEAIALFQKAVEKEPRNGEALLYLAGALAATGRSAEALPLFERALAAGQRSSMALNGLGLTRLALGDPRGAAQAFRDSLRLDPNQPDVKRTLSEIDRP